MIKKIFYTVLTIIATSISLMGCKKDGEEPSKALRLSSESIQMEEGETQNITIISGNGEYAVISANPKIATASINADIITVKAEAKGLTEITVKDQKNRVKKLQIKISEKTIDESKTFSFSESEKEIRLSDPVKTIDIISDNENAVYSVSSSNEEVATAEIDNENFQITITVKSSGEASIKVTDTKTSISKEIKITVPDSAMEGAEVVDGILVSWDCSLVAINKGHIKIPASVKTIGAKAFNACTDLINVEFHENVERIEERAFYACINLTNVELPKKLKFIGKEAFNGCRNIEEIVIPESITQIEEKAFQSCRKLKEITLPQNLTSIGIKAFAEAAITSIKLPATLTQMGQGAFDSCLELQKFEISDSNPNFSVQNGVLFNKTKTELIQYPIGKEDETYEIPSSVTSILYGAFAESEYLTNISIPEGVTYIGESAFNQAFFLEEVNLPNSLQRIEGLAFASTAITSITIPHSVTYLGESAFSNCESLKSIELSEQLTKIEGFTFYNCKKLSSITLPKKLTSIGKSAFYETALKEIIIPEGVTSLDEHSFSDCRVLEKVHLPATLKSIGKLAFNFTPKLKEIQCEATVPPTLGEQSFEKAGVYNDQGGKITLKVPEASADAYKNASQWKKFEVNP